MRWYDRLRRPSEIAHVRRRGRRQAFAGFTLYALNGVGDRSAVAVTASKAVGPAVTRNLIRRRLKGALDAQPRPDGRSRFVLVATPGSAAMPFGRLSSDVALALERHALAC